MANITHKIATIRTPEQVLTALTTLAGLNAWWTTDTSGDPGQGGLLEFRFNGQGPDMTVEKSTVSEVIWRVTGGPEDWIDTTVEFRLENEDDKTAIYFTHRNWHEENDFHYHCSMKWAVFMLSLKQYLDTGQGWPFPKDIQIEEPTQFSVH
jgi:uncharacterized protein YndB with AHSA1/START domain